MSRQNRVTPLGKIVATPERGTLTGNRGVLHDARGRIRRAWQNKRWIICLLNFRDRKRQVMSPGKYTELFFLDEATALAAGHRPCAECQRERFNTFRRAWVVGLNEGSSRLPSASEIDERLHSERLTPEDAKRTFVAALADLPDGIFVTIPEWGEGIYLVCCDGLHVWSAGGYTERRSRPAGDVAVSVLTPVPTVAALRMGYVPAVHHSVVVK
jgi:hypothetical protein